MIYPTRRKIRKFAGGGMASLFDNPGTYLGIQYIPTAQNLPDVEGLQYIAQMEQAKATKTAERAKANQLNTEDLSKELNKLRGLSGEQSSALNQIQSEMSSWYEKYPTAAEMASNEAANDKARILNGVSRISNELLNSKDEFDKSYDRSKEVLGDAYTDGSNIMIQNPENPAEIKSVSIPEYFEKKDSEYKGFGIMKNNDVFSWKRDYRQFGQKDGINVDQYSEKETRSYINDHFDKVGQNSRSIEGAGQFSGILADAGINPENFSRDDLKIKISNGDLNLEVLGNSFMKTLDHKVLKSLVSSMINNGENPYEKVTVEGMKEPVSNLNLRVHEILTGVKAGINSTVDISTDTGSGEGGSYSVLTNALGRTVNLDVISGIDPIAKRQIFSSDVFNPYTGQKMTAKGLIVPNLSVEDMERLNGGKLEFKEINNDQEVYFNGAPVRIGSVTGGGDGARYFDTGKNLNVITFDLNDGNNQDSRLNVIEKEILVNEAGLAQFGLTPREADKDTSGLVRAIPDSEIATLPGISEEMASSMNEWGPDWMTDSEHYLIRIRVPLSENAGHGGKSPGKASDTHNSTLNQAQQKAKKEAEATANAVSQTVAQMTNFPRK